MPAFSRTDAWTVALPRMWPASANRTVVPGTGSNSSPYRWGRKSRMAASASSVE